MSGFRYTDSQNERIVLKVDEAKSLGMDLSAFYSVLADEFDRTPKGIELQYHALKRAQKINKDNNVLDSVSILQKLKTALRSSDRIKEERDAFKQQRDEYKNELDKIKREYEKLLNDLSSLIEG